MLYSIGIFILDTEKEVLILASSKEVVSSHSRLTQLLSILVSAYPKTVSKNDLTKTLWPDDDVTEWALSRQISQLRQILANHDAENNYIKTVHTKGFKLEVEPQALEFPIKDQSSNIPMPLTNGISNSENSTKSLKIKPLWYLVFSVGLLIVLYASFTKPNKSVKPVYGEIFPERTIEFPMDRGWWSIPEENREFVPEGVLFKPVAHDDVFVMTSVFVPAFYQGSTFSIVLQANEDFVSNPGNINLFYQTTLEGWPGEWNCDFSRELLNTSNQEHSCIFDENGEFTKTMKDEKVNLGIKVHLEKALGHAIIKSAELHLPANISTDHGWRTTNRVPLSYERGVSYHPTSVADQLATRIRGKINISGSKIAYTVKIDDSYKIPEFRLQFFILTKEGKWQDCFINGSDIKSNIFTKICNFKNIKDPFILNENQTVEIGIRPYGKTIAGELKILGISISE